MKILYSCWTDGIPGLWGSTISTRATHIPWGIVDVVNGVKIAGHGEKRENSVADPFSVSVRNLQSDSASLWMTESLNDHPPSFSLSFNPLEVRSEHVNSCKCEFSFLFASSFHLASPWRSRWPPYLGLTFRDTGALEGADIQLDCVVCNGILNSPSSSDPFQRLV